MTGPKRTILNLRPYISSSSDMYSSTKNEDALKLDSNESTINPSPLVFQRIRDYLSTARLNWYPEGKASLLRERLSAYTRRPPAEIQVFNGSDSALDYICRTYVDESDEVLVDAPTYDMFRLFVEAIGAQIKFTNSSNPIEPNIQNLTNRITKKTKLIYVCNPNNPTGRMYTENDIAKLCENLDKGILIVDEAYYEYTKLTMSGLLDKYQNLIITRSFSKAFGLAALRCGFILADETHINHINKIRNEKDVNSIAQIAAVAALDDLDYMENYVKDVLEARRWLAQKLKSLGYEILSAAANFILIRVEKPEVFMSALRHAKVFVRDRGYLPQLKNCVRITVGNKTQCQKLAKELQRL
jgi:histidinol-phosphate aminotransferase